MKAATISELKKELKTHPPELLVDYCVRLAKHKKENKELLTYLLFESADETGYIQSVKEEIDEQFKALNRSSIYLIKKTVKKVLNTTHKYIRYSGKKQTEAELLIYFCQKLKGSGISLKRNRILFNLYDKQLTRISKALGQLHEDLQFDYEDELKSILL